MKDLEITQLNEKLKQGVQNDLGDFEATGFMIHKASPKVSGQDQYFYGNKSRSRSGNNAQEELNIYGDEIEDDNSGSDPMSAKKSPIGY